MPVKMTPTRIKHLLNEEKNKLMFLTLNDNKHNMYVDPGYETNPSVTDVGNCTVPYCGDSEQFPKSTIVIINMDTANVIAYIWQYISTDGDLVRYSKDGWHASGHKLNDAGGYMNITVKADGTIVGDKI